MNSENVKLMISLNGKDCIINMHIPSSYQYKMDRTTLMVAEKPEPSFGNIAGFYFYQEKNYDEINENTFSNGMESRIDIRNYDYKIENIFGHEFKTFCTEYLDDHTVNKTYIYKTNNDIVGRVEIQKIGTKDSQEYTEGVVSNFLGMLVNVDIEGAISNDYNNSNNNNNNNEQNAAPQTSGDAIIESLNKVSSTTSLLFIFAGLFLIAALVFYIADKDMFVVSIVCVFGAVIMGIMAFSKRIIGKNNLKKVDLDDVKKDINDGFVECDGTIMAKKYIISNHYHAFIIKYTDIAWIYPVEKYNQNGGLMGVDLGIFLINGKKEYVPYNEEISDIIVQGNPNVLVGKTSENKKKYKEIKKNNGQR